MFRSSTRFTRDQRLIHRHRSDRHRRCRRIASRIIGISPPVERSITVSAPKCTAVCSLRNSSSTFDTSRRVADIRIDLAQRRHANRHRLQLAVIDVGRNDHRSARHFAAHQLGVRSSRARPQSAISSVISPVRAKCICDIFQSPVRSASAFRLTIQSVRPVGTLYPLPFVPFPAGC